MDYLWMWLAIFAAATQAVRTAAQRTLNQRLSTLATTYVRSLYGLPVMLVYLAALLAVTGEGAPRLSLIYLFHTFVGALAQVIATMLLISMFRLRNFGVGTMLTKCDILSTAVIGWLFFSETLTFGGFVALLVVLAGVLLMTLGRLPSTTLVGEKGSYLAAVTSRSTQVALGCALAFSFSYLFLREATLEIEGGSFLWRGAWTVVIATAMQTVFVGAWMWRTERRSFPELWPNRGLSTFIGVSSALGSIAWFTAFALQNASYVRAVGQIEVVFTLMVAMLYFKERITGLEIGGIAVTFAGVLMYRLLT